MAETHPAFFQPENFKNWGDKETLVDEYQNFRQNLTAEQKARLETWRERGEAVREGGV